ncbi:MAG: LPS export ABC transporter permease LptG [Pseudomonadota bacterium]|nr:LPS export ABC transporter permease LptG [Pseudomonadota bacterium]
MITIRRLIYSQVLRSVGAVALAFLALFFFFDMVDELGDLKRGAARGYNLGYALLYVALQIPNHLYELLPIAALIGTIYVMAQMASSSEFTILRTSGLGPLRALRTLLGLGAVFVVITFIFGDYVAPAANRSAQAMQARFMGDITVGRTGAWMKERQTSRNQAVNVGAMTSDGIMNQVRIFEFDNDSGRLVSTTKAAQGRFADGGWELQQVERRGFEHALAEPPRVEVEQLAQWHWPTGLSQDMVAAALLSPDKMHTLDLFQYISHLEGTGQSAQRYEIAFWRKVFYPLSCLVMMVLALPFAYLHFRAGNIAGYVFIGVLVGISFFLLNNVFGHIGNLRNWEPWLTAAAPGFIYSLLSLALFGWLVLKQ